MPTSALLVSLLGDCKEFSSVNKVLQNPLLKHKGCLSYILYCRKSSIRGLLHRRMKMQRDAQKSIL